MGEVLPVESSSLTNPENPTAGASNMGSPVAITLAPFLRRATRAIVQKFPPLLSALKVGELDAVCSKIDRIIRATELQTRLTSLGVNESDLPKVAETARWDRIAQHPNPPTPAELTEMPRGIL